MRRGERIPLSILIPVFVTCSESSGEDWALSLIEFTETFSSERGLLTHFCDNFERGLQEADSHVISGRLYRRLKMEGQVKMQSQSMPAASVTISGVAISGVFVSLRSRLLASVDFRTLEFHLTFEYTEQNMFSLATEPYFRL